MASTNSQASNNLGGSDQSNTSTNNAIVSSSQTLSYTPTQAGQVIEAPDGSGGTCLIRMQNITATGELVGIISFCKA